MNRSGSLTRRARSLGRDLLARTLLGAALSGTVAAAPVDAPAPDFALPSVAQGNVRLSEQRGQVLLLAFWSSRCGRCDRHLEALDELVAAHADRGARMLVISIDRTDEASRRLAQRLSAPVLLDATRSVARSYELGPLPVTHLVDLHGRLRSTRADARAATPDELEQALLALLDE